MQVLTSSPSLPYCRTEGGFSRTGADWTAFLVGDGEDVWEFVFTTASTAAGQSK